MRPIKRATPAIGFLATLGAGLVAMAATASAATTGYRVAIPNAVIENAEGGTDPGEQREAEPSEADIDAESFEFENDHTGILFDDAGDAPTGPRPEAAPSFSADGAVTGDGPMGVDLLNRGLTVFDAADFSVFATEPGSPDDTPVPNLRPTMFPTTELTVAFTDDTMLTQALAEGESSSAGFRLSQVVPLPGGLALFIGAGIVGTILLRRPRR
ncbi:MAG: hypothetical protein AAFR84_00460 [Pseudomonadota bacterium]